MFFPSCQILWPRGRLSGGSFYALRQTAGLRHTASLSFPLIMESIPFNEVLPLDGRREAEPLWLCLVSFSAKTLEIGRRMLADRADVILRKFFSLVDVSADLANPAGLLLFFFLRLRLDVIKVILVG